MKSGKLIAIVYILFFIFTKSLHAQTISNNWYGSGTVDVVNSSNNYLAELILNEKNKKITGVFSYYFRDSLFSNKIEGTYTDDTRRLILKKQNIIFHRSNDTKIGADCPMYGEFTLRVSRTESVLNGVLFTDDDHKFTCPAINFNLKRSVDMVKIKKEAIVVSKMDSLKITSPQKIDDKQLAYEARQKIYTNEIEIEKDSIKIELYDNGQIDYDSVSIYLNDKLVLPKTMLTLNAIKLTLPLDEKLDFNELSMFADNLGLIPPNTAALILYDGTIRYEIMMSSDLSRTATIKLLRRKRL